MSSISGARCLLGAGGPSLGEGEGHGRLLFLSLPRLALAPEETSAEEGTTRPSRGQCDAGHVLPPAVLVSSISFVTSHSVDGELGPVPPPLRSRLSLPGWENPAPGRESSTCPVPPSPAHSPLRPWYFNSCPSNGQPTSGPVDLELCAPHHHHSSPGKGAYLCVPSVLSFMSPLSDLPPDPLPGQPVTRCLQGPALTSRGRLRWGCSPSRPCLISSPDAPSPFQVRRGLSATPPSLRVWRPPSPPRTRRLPPPSHGGRHHANVFRVQPFNSRPHRGLGPGRGPALTPPGWTRPGGHFPHGPPPHLMRLWPCTPTLLL